MRYLEEKCCFGLNIVVLINTYQKTLVIVLWLLLFTKGLEFEKNWKINLAKFSNERGRKRKTKYLFVYKSACASFHRYHESGRAVKVNQILTLNRFLECNIGSSLIHIDIVMWSWWHIFMLIFCTCITWYLKLYD